MVTCSILLAVASCIQTPPVDQTRGLLTAVAGAVDENRAKFPHGIVRFDYEDGFADSAEAARTGQLRDRCVAAGTYLFRVDEGHTAYLYTKEFAAADYAKHTEVISDTQFGTRLDSFQALADGDSTMFDQIQWFPSGVMNHACQIEPGMQKLFAIAEFPFELGFPEDFLDDVARHIRRSLKSEAGCAVESVEENVKLGGRTLVRFSLTSPRGKSVYLVDPAIGWMPVHRHAEMFRGTPSDYYFDDFRQVAGRGWLPFVKTALFRGDRVHRIVIREADFEKLPDRSLFKLEFPEPRKMVNRAKGLYHTTPQKTWRLTDLSKAPSATVKRVNLTDTPSARPSRASDIPGELEPRPWYVVTVIIAVPLLILAGAIWFARARRG